MMNVIIVSKFLKAPKKVSFGNPKVAAVAAGLLLAGVSAAFGAGYALRSSDAVANAHAAQLQQQLAAQRAELKAAREEAQREINAVAARVGELQAQANRLNALGERLTRDGKLSDGEFDFQHAPGMGGDESSEDMPAKELLKDLNQLQKKFDNSGKQLSVL